MTDNSIAAAALREALADHIRAAAEIAHGNRNQALAEALGQLAAEAIAAPASRMLGLASEVAARIEQLRIEMLL